MVARIATVAFAGVEVLDIDVQVQMGNNLPDFAVEWPKSPGMIVP